jgi:hypothetical protein
MSRINGKIDTKEIEGKNCVIVEDKIPVLRFSFLKQLLEFNGYQTRYIENPPPAPKEGETAVTEPTYTLAVTDLAFSPSLAIYNRKMKTLDGDILLPNYWFTGENKQDWYWKEKVTELV